MWRTAPRALAAVVAATALLTAGCSSSNGTGDGSSGQGGPVKLAVLAPSSLQWLNAIAKDQGFFEARGVQVTQIQVQDSSTLVQAVTSGSADAGIALGDNAMKAIDQGAKVTIAGAILQKAALRLYAGKGVDGAAGMRGGKVTAGAVAGGTTDLLKYQLAEAGLAKSDTSVISIPNSKDRVTALGNGQVKGALLIPPFDTMAAAQGSTMIGWYDQPYVETPLVVNTDWAKSHPAAAKGITQALADAARWIYDPANEAKAEQVLSQYTGADPTAAKEAYAFMVTQGKVISPDLSVPAGGLANIVKVSASANGQPEPTVDEAKYIDPSYLK
jgi:ABC-type nitrate/sulfonate/bicarbonate transport system substrate-binding protein